MTCSSVVQPLLMFVGRTQKDEEDKNIQMFLESSSNSSSFHFSLARNFSSRSPRNRNQFSDCDSTPLDCNFRKISDLSPNYNSSTTRVKTGTALPRQGFLRTRVVQHQKPLTDKFTKRESWITCRHPLQQPFFPF